MAGDWKNKIPNEPYVDSNGRFSVVLMHEWPLETKSTMEQYNEMKTWSFLLSVAKEGFQRLMQKYGREYYQNTWANVTAASLKINVAIKYASVFDPAKAFGSLARARFAHIGISAGDYVLAKRGWDLEGPYFPPRPGVGYGLYKLSIHPRNFEKFGPMTYENRTTAIMSKGEEYYKEIEFDSYEDLETQLAEVSAVLTEYESAHIDMQTQAADKDNSPQIFKGPEVGDPPWPNPDIPRTDHYGLLNLVDEAARLNTLSGKIKDFLNLNKVHLSRDKIIIGLYPTEPKYNPAMSINDADDSPISTAQTTPEEKVAAVSPSEFGTVTEPPLTSSGTKYVDAHGHATYFTNRYKVQQGDTLWKITKFYLGTGGVRARELIDANWYRGPDLPAGEFGPKLYEQRGWTSTQKLSKLEQAFDRAKRLNLSYEQPPASSGFDEPNYDPTELDQYISDNQELWDQLEKARKPQVEPGDILTIPRFWMTEILKKKNKASELLGMKPTWDSVAWEDMTKGMDEYDKSSVLIYEIQSTQAKEPLTPDGPPISTTTAVDPTWDTYHMHAGNSDLGQGKIAYFKLPSPTYSKAAKQYKTAKANLKSAPPTNKTLLETRFANAKLHLKDIAVQEKPFKWSGFLDLVYSKPAQIPRTLHFLTNLDIVVNEPGVKGALLRFCSPNQKPPKKAKKISVFVKKYIYDPPKATAHIPTGEESARSLYDARARDHHTPRTEKEANAWNTIVKSPLMKTAVARRNQKFSDQAGDAVFTSLPRSIDKINTLSDVHRYVLSRMDLPTLAEEVLKCLGLSLSLNDVIEAMCDGFLRKIGADPDKIDQFYDLLMSGEFNLSVESMDNLELIDTARMAADIQKFVAEGVAAGVDDPFYAAVIRQNIDNASGKMLICELIMSSIFALADMLANLESGPEHKDAVPPVGRCKVPPKLFMPKMPFGIPFGDIWYPIRKKLEQMLYSLLEDLIMWPIKELLESLADACAEEHPEFGAPPPPALPGKEEDLNRAFAGLGVESPRDFLAHLLSTLTQRELCELINGTAAPIILLHVRKFMRANYVEFYNLFSTDDKIFSFFKGLQGILDLSACVISPLAAPTAPGLSLDNLCKDGVTPRQDALKRSLLAKGLSLEQVEEQLEIDKQIKKDLISLAVDSMFPSPLEDKANIGATANTMIHESQNIRQNNDRAVNSAFDPLKVTYNVESARFIPDIKAKIATLESPAGGNYDYSTLPLVTQMNSSIDLMANNMDDFRGMSGLEQSFQHMFQIWIKSLAFTAGTAELKDAQGKVTQAGTKGLIDVSNQAASQKRLLYDMKSQHASTTNSDEGYYFALQQRNPNDGTYWYHFSTTSIGRTADQISTFAKNELKKYKNRTLHKILPQQVDVWLAFLTRKLEVMYSTTVSGASPKPFRSEGWYGIKSLETNVSTSPHANTSFPQRMVAQKIYNLAFESLYARVLNIIMTSPALDFSVGGENVLFDLDINPLASLEDIHTRTHEKVDELMKKTDFVGAGPPSCLGEAIFEGMAKSIIKIELLKKLVSSVPVFAKFKFDDAFNDPIINEFTVESLRKENIYDLFIEYYNEKEKKLRLELEAEGPLSTPPKKILSEEEISEKISKQLYDSGTDKGPYTTPEEYFLGFADEVASSMKEEIKKSIVLKAQSIDEEAEAQEAGLIQIKDKLKSTGVTSEAGDPRHAHDYTMTSEGVGVLSAAADGHPHHTHPIEKWVVQPAGADNHTHLLEESISAAQPAPEVHSITTRAVPLKQMNDNNDGLELATNWRDSNYNEIEGSTKSTLMQQHFPVGTYSSATAGNGGPLVEIPDGTTIPPGTNYYPGSTAAFFELKEPRIDGHGNDHTDIGHGAKRWFSTSGYTYKVATWNNSAQQDSTVTDEAAMVEFLDVISRARSDYEANHAGKGYWGANPSIATWRQAFSDIDIVSGTGIVASPKLSAQFSPTLGVKYYILPHTGIDVLGDKTSWALNANLNNAETDKKIFSKAMVDGYYIEKEVTWDASTSPPQNADQWGAFGLGSPYESEENPMIRLSVPFHGDGGDTTIEVFSAATLDITINGKNFTPDARVFFIGRNFGRMYEFEIKWETHKDSTKLHASMDISSYGAYGAHSNREAAYLSADALKNEDPKWGQKDGPKHGETVRVRYGHGHIDEMGKTFDTQHSDSKYYVVDDIYMLAVQTPTTGRMAFAPIYFHTFTPYARSWNNAANNNLDHYEDDIPFDTANNNRDYGGSALNWDGGGDRDGDKFLGDTATGVVNLDLAPQWRDKNMKWPNPEEHPQSGVTVLPRLGPRPWENLSAMNFQAFPLTVYGEDHERWDIVDVADVIGIKRDAAQGGSALNMRQSILCKPRLVNKKYALKLKDHGGFILEKYVKIKFKSESTLRASGIDEEIIKRIYGASTGDIATTSAPLAVVAISPADAASAAANEDGSWKWAADDIFNKKIYADEFLISEFTDKPGLVVPAQNAQILSYDAFIRLQQHLLGIPIDSDPTSTEAMSSIIAATQTDVNQVLVQGSFGQILSDFSYGLRVSYVLPLRGVQNQTEDSDALIGSGKFAAVLKNMFSPTIEGVDGSWDFDPPGTDQLHLTKVKALYKALHMIEYEGTGLVTGAGASDIYSMPPGDFAGGDLELVLPEPGFGEGQTTVENLPLHSSKLDKGFIKDWVTAGTGGTAEEFFAGALAAGSTGGTARAGTVLKVYRDVYVLPLIEAELRKGQDGFPPVVNTFQDLRRGYPSEEESEWVQDGKTVFNALYLQLRRNPAFKLLFEYIFPTKRMLGFNTIYTMESFKDMFPDVDVLEKGWESSTAMAKGIAKKVIENPTGNTTKKEQPSG